MRLCSGRGWYTPQYHIAPPSPVLPQWVVTPMSHPVDIWCPWPPSALLTGGGNSWGISPDGGSLPTSWNQIEAPLAPPPYITSPPFSYKISRSPKGSTFVPTLPAPSVGSAPPLNNCRRRTTTFVPINLTKELPSAVSHIPRRLSPYFPPSPQQPASVASSSRRI